MYLDKLTFCLSLLLFSNIFMYSQENKAILDIIEKIHDLEKDKDPKCYATASRLEDFMYGTPRDEEARNHRINIQKELIFYLKKNALN